MPEFIMDTSGSVDCASGAANTPCICYANTWDRLGSDIARGYIQAAFFTETAHGFDKAEFGKDAGNANWADEGSLPEDCTFADIAGSSLADVLKVCADFEASRAWADTLEGYEGADEEQAGHDLWLTRNGHGAGFWDGDWPEPHASALDAYAKGLGPVVVYFGDDGKVYLS